MTEDTGKKISEELKNDFTMDKLWAVLCLMQGERFYTARGLEFPVSYTHLTLPTN